MSTKAELFKARAQRTGRARRRKPVVRTRQIRLGPEAAPNASRRAARKAEVILEASQSGRPSRKSTRRSANKGKLSTSLERRQIGRTSSPKTRAARASAARTH